jgi:hypothetical protein
MQQAEDSNVTRKREEKQPFSSRQWYGRKPVLAGTVPKVATELQ